MSVLAQPHHVWTFEDLLALPGDFDPRSYEIVDGALVVSPSADVRHETISARLRRLLDRAALPHFEVIGPIAVDLHPSYRIPDLVVVSVEFTKRNVNPVPTADALLVVEIVSPSSMTTDRVTKPAQYAAYGIPVYLRVETEPVVTLTAYEVRGNEGVYTEIGTWGPRETAHLTEPFAVDVPIDAITP